MPAPVHLVPLLPVRVTETAPRCGWPGVRCSISQVFSAWSPHRRGAASSGLAFDDLDN